jgi:tetratricopeptide (TPR) repeat protein
LTREQDEDDLVLIYESKAMLEYSVGIVLEAAGKTDEAREAYSRALMEDMAFFAAHVQLGALALVEGDTLTALTEYSLAVEVEPTMSWLHAILGELQLKLGQHAEAAVELERAIELDPYYAEPYLLLAGVQQELGNTQDVIDCYQEFLARATSDHQHRQWVEGRLSTIAREP